MPENKKLKISSVARLAEKRLLLAQRARENARRGFLARIWDRAADWLARFAAWFKWARREAARKAAVSSYRALAFQQLDGRVMLTTLYTAPGVTTIDTSTADFSTTSGGSATETWNNSSGDGMAVPAESGTI